MAEKRMFSKKITESDAFLDMPASTQNLYFHLSMNADDEGFVDKAKSIMRMIGARDDDIRVLISKAFIIPFDSGVIVIKHWRMNNYLRKDRFTPTAYVEELNQLDVKENGSYTIKNNLGIPNTHQTDTQYRIDKNSIDKNSIDKESTKEKSKRFLPPTLEEVKSYCDERHNNVDPQRFIDFYESKGWMVGSNKMKSWKACVRTWEGRENKVGNTAQQRENLNQREYKDLNALMNNFDTDDFDL